MSLQRVAKNLRRINVTRITLNAIKKLEPEIVDTITEEQWFERGIDAFGKSFGQYSPFTIAIKEAKGQRTDHIALKDTGELGEKTFLNTSQFPIEIDSKAPHKDDVIDQFGKENVFNLTKENTERLANDQIREEIVEELSKAISKAFTGI